MTSAPATADTDIARLIQEECGENVYKCYQCKRCTAGCPLSHHFDLTPSQIMRAIQLGQEDRVLNAKTLWLCASCETCATRCPQGIEIVRVMDFLRARSRDRGIDSVPIASIFSGAFLRSVDWFGRLYELGLMGWMNLRSGQLFKDFDIAPRMFLKGKIGILPHWANYDPQRVHRVEPRENRVAYYPGCSLRSTATEFDTSTAAVAEKLDMELVEPPGWVCCGSTPAHTTSRLLAMTLSLKNLILFERTGLGRVVVPCVGCYARFRAALYDMEADPALKEEAEDEIGHAYGGGVEVKNVVEAFDEMIGHDAIREKVRNPLEGLRTVCYYGCMMTRPPEVTGAEHPEYPMNMDRLVEATGAEALGWDYKVDCCGASHSLTLSGLALELTKRILQNARDVGTDVVVVACPLCQSNLDTRQDQIEARLGLGFRIPVVYVTQLMGLAMGVEEGRLGLGKHLVDPRPLLREKGLM